ncbi:hypothetical protein V8C26DRAFT_402587 [Trichoderma gracile]
MVPPARDKFRIGWICALPVEVAAAKEMLDENFGILDEQDDTDTNSYTLGRVGQHYIAIASLGQYGTTSATAAAVNMMRTFSQSLRVGLMVGIAAGIPSPGCDMRLGDIVVSYPGGTCGGVVQYDMGKTVEDGKLVRTGALNAPPRSLLTAVASMRAAVLTDDPKYPEYIKKAIHRTRRTQKTFRRPDASTDRLFRADREHPPAASTCESCLPEWEQPREAREEEEAQMHYGIVASGNRVAKHAETRDRLHRGTGALCIEMEAAGLMMDFPCIIIRGICDYADSHKNKEWQGYAALAAAAYAKELLGYVPVGHVSQERLMAETCHDVVDQLGKLNDGMTSAFQQRASHHFETVKKAEKEELERCHQVFKTSTYEQYKNINPNRAEGTCRWILDNAQYHQWRDSRHNDLLWISADPGCGKSVLAKSLVDLDLDASGSLSICYFFFKDNEDQNNLATALCALLHQLFGTQPELLRHALPEWKKNGANLQMETDTLWRILETVVSKETFTSTVCILDALDECQEKDQSKLIDILTSFYNRSHSVTRRNPLKFMVTSRHYIEVQVRFRPATRTFPQIHIRGEEENEKIHEEINLIVKIRVEELGQDIGLSIETRKRLEQQLLQMEHRTYLWLHLAMEDIRTMFHYSLQPEQEIIQLIPVSVDAAYDKILNRVPQNKRTLVRMILQIIVGARRPLTIEELAIALGVAMSTNGQFAASAGLQSKGLDEKIRQLCGLFVFISSSRRVFLIHQTARQFLTHNIAPAGLEWPSDIKATHLYEDADDISLRAVSSKERKWYHTTRAQANLTILKICMAHMSKAEFDNGRLCVQRDQEYGHIIERRTDGRPRYTAGCLFLDYALDEWRNHAIAIYPVKMDQLHHLVVDSSIAPIARDCWLLQVSRFQLIKTISMLLENGANVEARDFVNFTPLWLALEAQNRNVVKLLVEMGADIETKHRFYVGTITPLMWAVIHGDKQSVKLLVELGADIEVSTVDYGTSAREAMGRPLARSRINVDATDDLGRTPLRPAIYRRQEDEAKLLTELCAATELERRHPQRSPLLSAINTGQESIVRFLIESGANIEARNLLEETPLMEAVKSGQEDIVKLLIDSGADIEALDRFGETPLIKARMDRNEGMAKLLIELGADNEGRIGPE